jgi:hypothetical protein
MDLGGFGNASGGRPGKGGARGIPSCADACRSGIQNDSGASAAPQQAMPAPLLQQLPPHGATPPAAVFAEPRGVLSAATLAAARCSCARMSAARVSAARVSAARVSAAGMSGDAGTACVARGG